MKRVRLCALLAAALALAAPLPAQFFVNSTADPGDGACTVANCTLREAITDANSGPLVSHFISFAIPGTGVHTIVLVSALPAILGSLTIDGYTQPGATPNTLADGDDAVLRIEIDGSGLGTSACGLRVGGLLAGNGTAIIRGLVINGFNADFSTGICLGRGGNNVIQGNFIGTNATGTAARPNYDGISTLFSSPDNTIGGTAPAARNVISGNRVRGIVLDSPDAIVAGNFIGTDAAGLAGIPNNSGIALFENAAGGQIGGAAAGSRNVISGNAFWGILYADEVAISTIAGNFVGVDVTGSAKLGNGLEGISGKGQIIIGGLSAGSGNVISGNTTTGVDLLAGGGSVLEGNFIGTDASGTIPLGNGQHGLAIELDASKTVVHNNRIAFNGLAGILVNDNPFGTTTAGNQFSQNSIFGNGGPGIDLGNDGVTDNDSADADTGPNGLQNFPVLTEVTASGAAGKLESIPATNFRLEFFANADCHSSGFGPGRTYLGFLNVTTDGAGVATFNAPLTVPAGQRVTATAMDPDGSTRSSRSAPRRFRLRWSRTPRPEADPTERCSTRRDRGRRARLEEPERPAAGFGGTATAVTGPAGPSYSAPDASTTYGTIAPAVTRSCTATPDCFQIFVSAPAARPAPHWDAAFTETLSVATPPKEWTLHIGETFSDVPRSYPFYRVIETIVHRSVTVGCTPTEYCPADKVPRDQMSLFLARAIAGGGANVPSSGTLNGSPYNCAPGGVSLFTDVSPEASVLQGRALHRPAQRDVRMRSDHLLPDAWSAAATWRFSSRRGWSPRPAGPAYRSLTDRIR